MSLTLVKSALQATPGLSLDAWATNETIRGEKVLLFRDYAEGDHRAEATAEMKANLRIGNEGQLDHFNDNYCPIIIDTMNDRLKVNGFEFDNEAPDEWTDTLLKAQRFDALQIGLHEATIRDGNTYLMVDIDPATNELRWTHEPAYDGSEGLLTIYATRGSRTPVVAIKVWLITNATIADTTRINVYYPNRIERFISRSGSAVVALDELIDSEPPLSWWTTNGLESGEPLGVPVFHFRNRGASYDNHGLSEIEDVIPLQDALNRTLHSMVATSELTGFPIRFAVGFDPPAGVAPGMWISANPKSNDKITMSADAIAFMGAVRAETLEQGEIVPFVSQAEWLRGEIYRVTNTPDDDMSSVASGESLKQREIKLIGKLERFQVMNGNIWEDVVTYSADLSRAAFASGTENAPEFATVSAQWKEVALRDDAALVESALAQFRDGAIDQRTYLEIVAPIYGWDSQKIDEIVAQTTAAQGGAVGSFSMGDLLNVANGNGLNIVGAGGLLNGLDNENGATDTQGVQSAAAA